MFNYSYNIINNFIATLLKTIKEIALISRSSVNKLHLLIAIDWFNNGWKRIFFA